jgi:hypothetical protein
MGRFYLTEEEAREFAQLEKSAGCDVGAGFDWGPSLGKFLAAPVVISIRQMLGLDELKQTRFYQEIAEEEREGVLALAIPALLEAGLTVEQIATKLKTDVPTVERIVQQQEPQN